MNRDSYFDLFLRYICGFEHALIEMEENADTQPIIQEPVAADASSGAADTPPDIGEIDKLISHIEQTHYMDSASYCKYRDAVTVRVLGPTTQYFDVATGIVTFRQSGEITIWGSINFTVAGFSPVQIRYCTNLDLYLPEYDIVIIRSNRLPLPLFVLLAAKSHADIVMKKIDQDIAKCAASSGSPVGSQSYKSWMQAIIKLSGVAEIDEAATAIMKLLVTSYEYGKKSGLAAESMANAPVIASLHSQLEAQNKVHESAIRNRADELNGILRSKDDIIEEQAAKIDRLIQNLRCAHEKINICEADHNLPAKAAENEAQKQQLTAEINHLRQLTTRYVAAQRAADDDEIAKLKMDVDIWQQKTAEMDKANGCLLVNAQSDANKIVSLEDGLAHQTKKVAHLEEECTRLKKESSDAKKAADLATHRLGTDMVRYTTIIAGLEETIAQFKTDGAEQTAEIADLKKTIARFESCKAKQTAEIAELETIIAQLEAKPAAKPEADTNGPVLAKIDALQKMMAAFIARDESAMMGYDCIDVDGENVEDGEIAELERLTQARGYF
jgi:hypothetical protein